MLRENDNADRLSRGFTALAYECTAILMTQALPTNEPTKQAVEASATYSNKTFRTITSIDCSLNEGTNWGRAVGSYTTSIVCTYKKTSSTSYTMQITYELHDVYDWDPKETSMDNLPVSPRDMWELHHGGMAKNYEVFGQNTFTLTWTQGQTFSEGAVMSNET